MTLSLTTRSGVGRALTWAEADANWSAIQSAVNGLLSASPGVGIASITQPTSNTLLITLTNAATYGFSLPIAQWNWRGAWAASTAYVLNDVFQINGVVYLVIWAHTSATTFSAGANDGSGHNYYAAMLSLPSDVLPAGGAAGAVLAKNSGTDFDTVWTTPRYLPTGGATGKIVGYGGSSGTGAWIDAPTGLPSGGADGQVVEMVSGSPAWTTPSGGGGSLTPATISGTSKTLASGDANTFNDCTSTTGCAITIPTNGTVAFAVGTRIEFRQSGATGIANGVAIAGASGVTVNAKGQAKTQVLGDVVGIIKTATDTWEVYGDETPLVGTSYGSGVAPEIDPGDGPVITLTPVANCTVTAPSGFVGIFVLKIATVSTSYTVDFDSSFVANGTVTTGSTAGKHIMVSFIGDGTNYYETGRVGPM